MKKVEPGDVLIISMTDPNYIPAMEKAGAFVTDMGGILCHAAIVAREMKKPCIIATKNATSVFKDGDKVIVDAEKGEVRKV
jgi:pyruvate,water dikinase